LFNAIRKYSYAYKAARLVEEFLRALNDTSELIPEINGMINSTITNYNVIKNEILNGFFNETAVDNLVNETEFEALVYQLKQSIERMQVIQKKIRSYKRFAKKFVDYVLSCDVDELVNQLANVTNYLNTAGFLKSILISLHKLLVTNSTATYLINKLEEIVESGEDDTEYIEEQLSNLEPCLANLTSIIINLNPLTLIREDEGFGKLIKTDSEWIVNKAKSLKSQIINKRKELGLKVRANLLYNEYLKIKDKLEACTILAENPPSPLTAEIIPRTAEWIMGNYTIARQLHNDVMELRIDAYGTNAWDYVLEKTAFFDNLTYAIQSLTMNINYWRAAHLFIQVASSIKTRLEEVRRIEKYVITYMFLSPLVCTEKFYEIEEYIELPTLDEALEGLLEENTYFENKTYTHTESIPVPSDMNNKIINDTIQITLNITGVNTTLVTAEITNVTLANSHVIIVPIINNIGVMFIVNDYTVFLNKTRKMIIKEYANSTLTYNETRIEVSTIIRDIRTLENAMLIKYETSGSLPINTTIILPTSITQIIINPRFEGETRTRAVWGDNDYSTEPINQTNTVLITIHTVIADKSTIMRVWEEIPEAYIDYEEPVKSISNIIRSLIQTYDELTREYFTTGAGLLEEKALFESLWSFLTEPFKNALNETYAGVDLSYLEEYLMKRVLLQFRTREMYIDRIRHKLLALAINTTYENIIDSFINLDVDSLSSYVKQIRILMKEYVKRIYIEPGYDLEYMLYNLTQVYVNWTAINTVAGNRIIDACNQLIELAEKTHIAEIYMWFTPTFELTARNNNATKELLENAGLEELSNKTYIDLLELALSNENLALEILDKATISFCIDGNPPNIDEIPRCKSIIEFTLAGLKEVKTPNIQKFGIKEIDETISECINDTIELNNEIRTYKQKLLEVKELLPIIKDKLKTQMYLEMLGAHAAPLIEIFKTIDDIKSWIAAGFESVKQWCFERIDSVIPWPGNEIVKTILAARLSLLSTAAQYILEAGKWILYGMYMLSLMGKSALEIAAYGIAYLVMKAVEAVSWLIENLIDTVFSLVPLPDALKDFVKKTLIDHFVDPAFKFANNAVLYLEEKLSQAVQELSEIAMEFF
ncbi:hypothetical protein DRN86_04755, partial [Candidatus Geothermarchaeota archaeon]